MGPFDRERQKRRIANCDSILGQQDLTPRARRLWTQIRNSITLDEDEYNRRVKETYQNLSRSIVEWNP